MGEYKRSHSGDRKNFFGFWGYKRSPSRDLKSPEDFSGMGAGKKATMTPATVEPTTSEILYSECMGASKCMSKDKSMDASKSRADNRRNTCNSIDASNIMD
jgi:hypothetical protein